MATLNQLKKELFDKESRLSEARLIQERRKKKKAELEAKLRAQQAELLAKKDQTDRLWRQEYAAQLPPVTDFITDVGPPSRPGDVDQRASEAALLDSLIAGEPTRDVVTEAPVRSGLTFNDPAYDVAADVGPVTDLDTPDDSEYYLDRLAAVKDSLGPMPSFPTAGFMDPRISAQREKLQKRRNILRSLYGKGPKDIVWGTGKPGAENLAHKRAQYKEQLARYTEAAYAMTRPETGNDLIDLSQALGLPLEQLADIHKKVRPDFAWEKARFEAFQEEKKLTAVDQAALIFDLSTDNKGNVDKKLLKRHTTTAIKQGGVNAEALQKELDAYESMLAVETPEWVTYSWPWRWEAKYKPILDKVKKEYGKTYHAGAEGARVFGGKAWYTTPPNQSNTQIRFNLNDKDDVAFLNQLSALNLPGFAEYTDSDTRFQFMDPNDRATKSVYDPGNASMADFAAYMQRTQNVAGIPSDAASKVAQDNAAQRSQGVYRDAARKQNQATAVLEMTNYMEQLPPGTLGGVASLELTFANMVALGKDFAKFFGLEDTLTASEMAENKIPLSSLADSAQDEVTSFEDRLLEYEGSDGFINSKYYNGAKKALADMKNEVAEIRTDMANKKAMSAKEEEVWSGRIAARLMSSALATLVARLYSTNDRLLKDQYMAFKERTNLTGLGWSERFAKSTIKTIAVLAKMRLGAAEKTLAGFPQPTTWRIDEETGMLYNPPRPDAAPAAETEGERIIREMEKHKARGTL